MSTHRTSLAVSLLALLGLVLPSCGDDDAPPKQPDAPKCDSLNTCSAGGAGGMTGVGGMAGVDGVGATSGGGSRPDPGPDCEDPTFALTFQTFEGATASRASDFRFLPDDSGRLLITTTIGKLNLAKLDGDSLELTASWDVPDTVIDQEACGLTNLLIDPEFNDNGFIYLTYCTDKVTTRLMRYNWSEEDGLTEPAIIFETLLPAPTDEWHRFGSLGFEADGKTLWMMAGDHNASWHGQSLDDAMGALLRIVPNREPGGSGHEIPEGNMASVFGEVIGAGGQGAGGQGAGGAGGQGGAAPTVVDPAVFAYGLRSPWRATRDSLGRVWVGDVGNAKIDEINLVSEVGQNFGWNRYEGPCPSDCDGLTNPVTYVTRSTDHPYVQDDPDASSSTKRAIWVGDIYESPAVDRYCGLMNGVVPFGDMFAGFVRGLRANEAGELTFDEHLGHLRDVVSWHLGADGYAYALSLSGRLSRVLLADPATE
jgi:hypothetical protein